MFTTEILLIENIDSDAAAWRYALSEYLGFNKWEQYDELVLLNDTFYGLLYPFHEIFGV